MLTHLGNQWSLVHFVSCLIAFAGFAAAFVASAGYVLQERLLKTKRVNAAQRYLPALGSADRVAYRMAAFGFLMLTLGMVAGAVRSQITSGGFWRWEPMETWSLITWLVYAAYLHVRVISGWRGKWTNRLLAAGFACVILTLFWSGFLVHG
jgi:ABC-type transport system involved in cytochrome c biogenesis permease subunit